MEMFSVLHAARRELLIPVTVVVKSGYLLSREAGANDVLVSAMTATPNQSRTSFSASLGTTKDTRKIGKNLFPVHRKATISSSAASKVRVLLEFRPLRTFRV